MRAASQLQILASCAFTDVRLLSQVERWPAYSKWSREHLVRTLAGKKLLAGGFPFSLDEYFAYADQCR